MIQRAEVFRTKGKTFDTFRGAIDYREGLVEEFLRKLPGFDSMRHKERIAFVQAVLANRPTLRELLDYSDAEPEDN